MGCFINGCQCQPICPFLVVEEQSCVMEVFCVSSALTSTSSIVSVVFDFNASLNAFAPVSPILLSVYVMRMENKGELLMDVFCVSSFVFTHQIEFSECCV